MSGRPPAEITEALAEVLRPLVAELVAEEVERRLAERESSEPAPFETVKQYAERHHTTPAAVRARIRRGRLYAERPDGAREYLIPNDEQPGGLDG